MKAEKPDDVVATPLHSLVMASWELKSVMAERIHSYFTASDDFPANIDAAFEDGKKRFVSTLERHIEAIKQLTIDDYRKVTGSAIRLEP